MAFTTKLRLAITAIVCLSAFYVSFNHIISVAIDHGNTQDVALVYPITIDGLILVSALSLMESRARGVRFWAWVGRYVGFACTLYANTLHSGWESVDSIVVNLIPGVSLIITVELLIHTAQRWLGMRNAKAATSPRKTASKAPGKAPKTVPTLVPTPQPTFFVPGVKAALNGHANANI